VAAPFPQVDISLRRFLAGGRLATDQQEALAELIDQTIVREVQRSLRDALELARALVRKSAKLGGPVAISSYRALARAALMSGRYAEAEKAYLRVRRLPGIDPVSRGRIDRTLIDVYMYLGKFAESKRRARLAMQTFAKLALPAETAKTEVNYANLLHRQDRHREAEELYRKAATQFESNGNELAAARCYFNRGNTLVQLFEFDEAERLYADADKIYRKHGYDLDAVDARWGISWLHMLQGKFHVALYELHDCETAYQKIGSPLRVASCVLDRAEVYLNLNLFQDALESSSSAERKFNRLGIRYESAKAAFYRAMAAFALDRRRDGRAALKRAENGFASDKNRGFLGAVHLLAGRVSQTAGARRSHLQQAQRLFTKAQLPLWQAVCDLHVAADPEIASRALARLEHNAAAITVPHFYARWQTLLGDLEARDGNIDNAVEHWSNAADRLDAVRAQLPPVELRGSFGRDQANPHARLITAELTRNPMAAAAWSERLKTAGLWAPTKPAYTADPARTRVEESLMALASQVASLSRQISGGERSLSAGRHQVIPLLERQVRNQLISLEQSGQPAVTDTAALALLYRTVSRTMPVVQFHVSESDIVAFVHKGGATQVHRFPYGRLRAEKLVARWRFLLESAALADLFREPLNLADERALFDEIGSWLWAPLGIPEDCESILLLPEGELANLPWHAIRFRGMPLLDRHRIVLSPSLRHHARACQIRVQSERVMLFLGRSDDLPHLRSETDTLGSLAGDHAQQHESCRRADWPSRGTARIWHFAGHANLNRENPFYSSLSLEDGPLFAADFRLRSVKVWLVTVAACQTGVQTALPGEESTGLVRSLLEMGARNVIAGHWPVSDRSTARWMSIFYERLYAGAELAEAAREAALVVRSEFPSAYHWAAFSIFGAGS
jgi:tetratricopeptide (TPR) repeat protein